MRSSVLFALSAALIGGAFGLPERLAATRQKDEPKEGMAEPAKLTPAAELTLTKALKAKVSGQFTDVRLGDILKEFAAQVEMSAEVILLWTYGKDFPYAQKVTYSCKSKPLEEALDELFKKAGTLGYVVVSKGGDRHDGWVLLTTTGERGAEKEQPKASAAEEADAAAKLTLAKKLIDGGKDDQAKTVLTCIVKRYPAAKAAAEAKELLAKLGK
jgi:hypothetical protein